MERFINLYIHLGLQSYSEKGSGPVRKGVKAEKKTLALISSTWKHKDLQVLKAALIFPVI